MPPGRRTPHDVNWGKHNMAKRLATLLVALLALGFVVSGCGDDDEDKAGNENTATQAAPATTDRTAEEDSAATGIPDSPQTKQAVESCKKQAEANTELSADAKTKIAEVCEEAGAGDADGAVKAIREACKIIVEDTAEGPRKQQLLDTCKQSTPTP